MTNKKRQKEREELEHVRKAEQAAHESPAEATLDKEAMLRRIQAKYARLTTSSEDFAARKAEEIALEDRRR